MSANDSDSGTLLTQAFEGDGLAWTELFQRLWPVVVKAISAKFIRILGDDGLEDAIQNAFVHLLKNDAACLRTFRPDKGSLEAFVCRVAYNATVDYIRVESKYNNTKELPFDLISPEMEEAKLPEMWEVKAAFEILTPREKEVMLYLFIEHLDFKEVAERLNIANATVRSLKSHALQKLRDFFRDRVHK